MMLRLVLLLSCYGLLARCYSLDEDHCILGLKAYWSAQAFLNPHECHKQVNGSFVRHVPQITFDVAKKNDVYVLMLLGRTHVSGQYHVNWLLSNVTAYGLSLNIGAHTERIVDPYVPPQNGTKYGFYLYNITGNRPPWSHLSIYEQQQFNPSQWFIKNGIRGDIYPVAVNLFSVMNATKPSVPSYQPWAPPQGPPAPSPPNINHPPITRNYPVNINGTQYSQLSGYNSHGATIIFDKVVYKSYTPPGLRQLTPVLDINGTLYTWSNRTQKLGKGQIHNINETIYVPIPRTPHRHSKKSAASTFSLFFLPTILLPLISLKL